MKDVRLLLLFNEISKHVRQGNIWLNTGFILFIAGGLPVAFGVAEDIEAPYRLSIFFWIAMMLSVLLMLDSFFIEDSREGTLDLLLTTELTLGEIITIKCIAQWIILLLPLMVSILTASPLLGIDFDYVPLFFISLSLGGLGFVLLGCLIASLTIALRSRHILGSILLLPMSLPIAMLGAGSISVTGDEQLWAIFSLAALVLFYLLIVPQFVTHLIQEFR